MQQNKTTLVQSPVTTLGQETRWVYFTVAPNPHGPKVYRTKGLKSNTKNKR